MVVNDTESFELASFMILVCECCPKKMKPTAVKKFGHAIVDATDDQKDPNVSRDWRKSDDGWPYLN